MELHTVEATLEGLIAATISFIVLAFSSLLVAIQAASAQLTPCIIATTRVRSQNEVEYLLLAFAVILAAASPCWREFTGRARSNL